ncbi:DUF3899 domain-containing protein [Bacillus massiliglaciei]|uniref:DUF3899 domain-containing protein n=1 Tax=Bacillus massiliglaciei TaxID=1816693 RepID=UPI000DA63046|nr:DUF3899 domain-containing protein [Bacillus massiliglaciei]
MTKRITVYTIICLLLSVLLSFICYKKISLLHFIDLSFYIAGALFIYSLLTFVIQKGFFDRIFESFRIFAHSEKKLSDDEEADPRSLSELISLPTAAAFGTCIAMLVIVVVALYIYYL